MNALAAAAAMVVKAGTVMVVAVSMGTPSMAASLLCSPVPGSPDGHQPWATASAGPFN